MHFHRFYALGKVNDFIAKICMNGSFRTKFGACDHWMSYARDDALFTVFFLKKIKLQ